MHSRAFFVLTLCCVLIEAQFLFAQSHPPISPTVQNGPFFHWTRTRGPYGGGAEALYTTGTSWYLGTFGGVFRSSDQGAEWSASGLDGKEIFRIGGNNAVLLASSDSILYRSPDQAGTWDSVWRFDAPIQCIASSGSTLYVTLNGSGAGPNAIGGGMYKSTDNAAHWNPAITGQLQRAAIRAIVPIGNVLVVVTNHNGVFRSTDGGGSWSPSSSGLPAKRPEIWSVTTRNGTGTEIVIAGSGRSLYFSADQGATWQAAACAGVPTTSDFYTAAFNGQTGVASTIGDSAYVSSDDGASWTMLSGSFPQGAAVYSMTSVNGKFLAGLDRGLHESILDGITWQTKRQGQNAASVFALVNHAYPSVGGNTTLFAGGDAGVQWSTDFGNYWIDPLAANETHDKIINTFLELHDTLYAGGEGFYQYSDASLTWSHMTQQDIGVIEDLKADTNGKIFAAVGTNGVAMSADGGRTWVSISSGLPHDSGSTSSIVVSGAELYAAVTYVGNFIAPANFTGVWHSSDRGMHWTFAGQGIYPDVTVNNLYMQATSSNEKFVLGTSNGYYASSDGAAWHQGAFDTSISVIIIPYRYGFIISGDGVGVFAKRDDQAWHFNRFPVDPTVISATEFIPSSNDEFMGTRNSGAWRTQVQYDTAVDEFASGLPERAQLDQNYPNPVRSPNTSKIIFSLIKPAHVTLTVHDALGRTVAVLIDDEMRTGMFGVDFRAAGLPTGMYEFTLRTGDKIESKRMQIEH